MQTMNDCSCKTAEAATQACRSPGPSALAQMTPSMPRTRCTVGPARAFTTRARREAMKRSVTSA